MSDAILARPMRAGTLLAAVTVLAAAAIPMATAREAAAADVAQVSDIALSSNVLDPSALLGALDVAAPLQALDLSGLFNAELDAFGGMVQGVLTLPGDLFSAVENGIGYAVFDALHLDLGDAFSALASIPLIAAESMLAAAVNVPFTLYEMALVIPGEFLLNFGVL